MSRRPPITLRRPEGGAEHGVTFSTRHNCAAARLYRTEEGFEGVDEVLFPVGITGYEMPAGVPFVVESVDRCEACGAVVRAEFMWSNNTVFVL